MGKRRKKTSNLRGLGILKSLSLLRKIVISLVILLIISLTIIFLLINQNLERNRVVSVADGDSFQTKDNRRIRLLAIDAPERGRCGWREAQERLSGLVLGKRVTLTDTAKDDYGRILANVWEGGIFVNKIMVEEGLAKFEYVSSPYYGQMKEAGGRAKEAKLGIYSDNCRSILPKNECAIKGNINTEGKKSYFLPYCPHYSEVIVDEAFGDAWFCTEMEAEKAGFGRAEGCK